MISVAPPHSLSDELTINVHNPRSYPPDHPARPPSRKETPPMPLVGQLEPPPLPDRVPAVLAVNAPAPSEPRKLLPTQTLQGPPESSPRQKIVTPVRMNPSSGRIRAAMAMADEPTRAVRSSVVPENARNTPVALTSTGTVPPSSPRSPKRTPVPGGLRKANWVISDLMRGGSQPPFRSDSPNAHAYIPKAPRLPSGSANELVETLALPPGLTGAPAPLETLPSSVIDARVQFTFLSRELAREYQEELGIVLRVDLTSIELMQAQLLERYPDRTIHSVEEAIDMKKHGALLSEILARTFDAFWVDIAPSDLGYWAMVIPPDTRIWPFGRILRLIAMQHKERDLVAYYLELQARAGAR